MPSASGPRFRIRSLIRRTASTEDGSITFEVETYPAIPHILKALSEDQCKSSALYLAYELIGLPIPRKSTCSLSVEQSESLPSEILPTIRSLVSQSRRALRKSEMETSRSEEHT